MPARRKGGSRPKDAERQLETLLRRAAAYQQVAKPLRVSKDSRKRQIA